MIDFKSPGSAQSIVIHEDIATTNNITTTILSTTTSTTTITGNVIQTAKRPKWEVIEHFKSNDNGADSVSSSLIAVC